MIMTTQYLGNPVLDRHQTWYTSITDSEVNEPYCFLRSQGQRTIYSGYKKTLPKQYLEKPLLVSTL